MRIIAILLVTIAVACTGCKLRVETEPKTLSEGVSYGNTEDQERFKQALTTARIPYDVTVQNNKESIYWDVSYSKAVEKVKDSLFVPSGRNISLDEQDQPRFKAWLEQRKIPYRTMIENKREYIVWEEVDSKRVQEWEDFPPYRDATLITPGQ
jgi:hypothetical protein